MRTHAIATLIALGICLATPLGVATTAHAAPTAAPNIAPGACTAFGGQVDGEVCVGGDWDGSTIDY